MAAPALAQRLAQGMLGMGLHDRMRSGLGGGASRGAWARALGESVSVGRHGGSDAAQLEEFARHGPSYQSRTSGLQLGRDVLQAQQADGGQVRAGLYAGLARITGDVRAVYGRLAGTVAMDGYALGAYGSRWSEAGWYADGTLQAMRYDRVRMRSRQAETMGSSGWGLAASVEGGYAVPLGGGWTAMPQAQLIYQRAHLSDASDRFGRARFEVVNAAYLRLGARLERNRTPPGAQPLSLWARANLWQAMGAGAKTTFTTLQGSHPLTLRTGLGRTWGQVGAGFTAALGPRSSVSGSVDYSQGFETRRDKAVAGHVLLTVKW